MFELTLTLPRELRYAATVKVLAVHAAQSGGADATQADAFGRRAEELARTLLLGGTGSHLAVVVTSFEGPVTIRLDHQWLTLDR